MAINGYNSVFQNEFQLSAYYRAIARICVSRVSDTCPTELSSLSATLKVEF